MANAEHVAILKDGVAAWNRWRGEQPDEIPDLIEATLIKMDLRGANLSRANLRAADLRSANLGGASLVGANLINTDLLGATLIQASLAETYLIQANLTRTTLIEVDFRRADLMSADLAEADLRNSNFTLANLTEVSFRGANLSGVDFTQAALYETVFGNTNLQGAKGLDSCHYLGPSTIDHRTLARSGSLSLSFLRGCGLSDRLIEQLPTFAATAIRFYSCFISYSHADKRFARGLHDTLQDRGIRCWLDEKQLVPGDDIYEQVDRGIRLWDKVLLCCSEHSLSTR